MASGMNYDRLLLRAVDLFLEQTPAASARAHRIIRKCQASLKPYSVDDLRWGGVITELTDSEFTNDTPYLSKLRQQLVTGHWQIERLYLNYDLRDDLSGDEIRWYEALHTLSGFLGNFPHADVEAAIQQYQQMVADVRQAQFAVPPVPEGDETLFQLVLAEITAVLTQIQLELSLRVYHFLTPSAPLQYMLARSDDAPPIPPDAADSVAWAHKALDALAGKAQMFVTWQVRAHGIRLVFH